MRKKFGILMAAIIFILTAFSGCGDSSSVSGSKNIKIMLALNEPDTFRLSLVEAAQAEAS